MKRFAASVIWHLIVTMFVFAFVFTPTSLLTQHIWAPFDLTRAEVIEQVEPGSREVLAVKHMNIGTRYPVIFHERLVHMQSNEVVGLTQSSSMTGRTGEFIERKTLYLPENYETGRWCRITEAEIRYNIINTKYITYPYACFVAR